LRKNPRVLGTTYARKTTPLLRAAADRLLGGVAKQLSLHGRAASHAIAPGAAARRRFISRPSRIVSLSR
jgi:hypothetical protein